MDALRKFEIVLTHFFEQKVWYLSKAARGRPEGQTEQSVFKIFFVMLAKL